MYNYGYLMLIFAAGIFAGGVITYLGFDTPLLYKIYDEKKRRDKRYLKYLGKIVMLVALSPLISGGSAFLFEDDSFIPVLILLVSMPLLIIMAVKVIKE